MKITFHRDGKTVTHEADNINMQCSLDAYKLLRKIDEAEGAYNDELVDEGLRFVVKVFEPQFTKQELLSYCVESFFVAVPRLLREIVAGVANAIEEHPNSGAATATGAG